MNGVLTTVVSAVQLNNNEITIYRVEYSGSKSNICTIIIT